MFESILSSESSRSAFWIAKAAKFLHADNKDSDQMCRLVVHWVHVSRYVFSHLASYGFEIMNI